MPDLRDPASFDKNASPDHPMAWGIMAAFMRTGKKLDHASSVLLLGMLLLYTVHFSSYLNSLLMLLALLLALLEKYLAWRVALDAELFALLSRWPEETAAFDAALAAALSRPPAQPRRSMQSRWLGARRLLYLQVAACVAQVLMLLALLVWQGLLSNGTPWG